MSTKASPGDATPEAKIGDTEGETFIFRWEREKRFNWRLSFVLLLSFGAHLFGFYLFTVAYRPAERVLPKPARVFLLSTAAYPEENATGRDAAARTLARLRDRMLVLQPSILQPTQNVMISDYRVTLRPSFVDHQLELRPPSPGPPEAAFLGKRALGGVPHVFDPERVILPSADSPGLSGSKPVPLPEQRTSPEITAEGALAGRILLPAEDIWTPELMEEAGGNRFRIRVGVDRLGRVVHALVQEGAGSEADTGMLEAVRRLRFELDPSTTSIDWGNLILQW